MSKLSLSMIDPRFLVAGSRALASLRPAIIAFLIAHGTKLSGDLETPISFCNVLFVGNLCAALAIGFRFGFGAIIQDYKESNSKLKMDLFVNGCLAALLSALIYSALEFTTVTNTVLLGRLGPVIYAIAGALILGKIITKREWFGFSLITVGTIAIVLKVNMYHLNQGDLLIILSSFVYAGSSIISKLALSKDSSLRLIVFSRNFVSAVIFFIIATSLFGLKHFADLFSGQLWIIMFIYAIFTIVIEQFMWYSALEKLDATVVGRWTIVSPIFGVIYAYFLNGERPSDVQYTSFAIILVGVIISSFGKPKSKSNKKAIDEMTPEVECTASA